jgi:hypothetical protein
MQYVAFDAHKYYTWARVERSDGTRVREQRIPHERGALRGFLAGCEPGSPVAIETVGNWYWMVDETEAAGCAVARHPAEAAYWVLTKREPYREPGSSTEA